MPIKSALYFLWHKYIHELKYDNYHMDMLRLIALPNLKESPERYYDLTEGQRNNKRKVVTDYTVDDVVDMFAGVGKLV